MESVGIELVLKQNLAAQLKTILPMLTKMNSQFTAINKSLGQMETFQNNANRGFQRMANQMQAVNAQSKGLQTINQHVKGVGQAATGATRQVGLLGTSLGGLMRTLGPLVGIYKIMQGVGAIGGAGLDFEKQVKSLQQSNLTPGFQRQLTDKSLQLGSSGKYAMSGADFIGAFKETRSVSRSPQDALNNLPLIGEVDMKMRKINKDLAGQSTILPRFFEKFAAYDDKSKRKIADALLKGEQYVGGTISPGQLLQQISTSGTSVVGADPYKMMIEQMYSIKESASGMHGGGGSGGRGRGGVGQQAVDRMMNLGVLTPAQAEMMRQGGMLDGISAAGSTKGHKFLIDSANAGKHVLTQGGGSGSGRLKTSDVQAFLLKNRPAWMTAHANDTYQTGLDFAAGADILGGNKIPGSFMATRDAHIKHFGERPIPEQKFLEGRVLSGMKMTGIDFLMERSVGAYKKSHDIFTAGIEGQPGLAATGATSVADRWEMMMKQFETFGNALGNSQEVISAANRVIDGLTVAIKALNDNVGPIAKFLANIAAPFVAPQQPPAEWVKEKTGGHVDYTGSRGGLPLALASKLPGYPGYLPQASKMLLDPPGGRQHLGNMSLVPPPPPVTSLVDPTLARAFNDPSRHDPSSLRMPPGATPKSTTIQNNIYLDGKKIAEHTAHHVEKQQLKSARKMSYGGGRAGGSYTDQYHNAGTGQ